MRRSALVLSFAAALGSQPAAAAEPRNAAAAEALFGEGKALMDRGNYVEGCPKLEESFRLDPAAGAMYALALCHERQGRLASAWAEYLDAAARSRAEHNQEREMAARQHAEALEPRLSFLILRVHPATAKLAGLVIYLGAVALRPAGWSTPMPTDPGTHALRAIAPGYEPWSRTVTIGSTPERQVVEVPQLSPSGKPEPLSGTPRAEARPTALQLVSLGLGSAGIASLGFGAFASWRALQKKAASDENCDGDVCEPQGDRDRVAAREAALFATVGAVAGGALLAAGVTLFVVGRQKAEPPAVKVSASLGWGGARVDGSF